MEAIRALRHTGVRVHVCLYVCEQALVRMHPVWFPLAWIVFQDTMR